MFGVQLKQGFSKARRCRGLAVGMSLVGAAAVLAFVASPFAAHAAPASPASSPVAASRKPDPELLLIEVYKALGANQLRKALATADMLVSTYPNFRLGHLLRGDLLLMQTQPVNTLGAVGGPEEKLKALRDEAMVRLKSLRERPDPSMVPRLVLQLRDDQKQVLLVDARRSRLYVYAHENGQLRYVTDYYVSQGKYGVNKLREGDQKTPVGVYYITSRLAGSRLPDFYGTGALPINYPNEWDRVNGRSGSGIWLHGTPSDSFSRPPLSSDGCVVLTNPDLHQLSRGIEVGKTPVVISETIEFVNMARWNSERSLAARLVDGWRRDFESLDAAKMMSHYSRNFTSDRGEDLRTWFSKHQEFMKGLPNVAVQLKDVSHFYYPGRDDMIVSSFSQVSSVGRSTRSVRKRQYWVREGAHWRIVHELNL